MSGSAKAVNNWNLGELRESRDWPADLSGVSHVASAPEPGRLAVSASEGAVWLHSDSAVRVHDLRANKPVSSFVLTKTILRCLTLSPDGRHLLTINDIRGGPKATIRLWDAATGKQKASWLGEDTGLGSVTHGAFCPHGRCLVLGHCLCIIGWDPDAGQVLWRLEVGLLRRKDKAFSGFDVSRDGKWLATADFDGRQVKVWEIPAGPP